MENLFQVEVPTDCGCGDAASLDTDDFERLAGIEKGAYWYTTGFYEGSGYLVYQYKGKWGHVSLGHCSCYGPTDEIDMEGMAKFESLEALIANCSDGLKHELSTIIAKLSPGAADGE